MKEFLVMCINKPNRMSSHEHITHIGNITNDPANRGGSHEKRHHLLGL